MSGRALAVLPDVLGLVPTGPPTIGTIDLAAQPTSQLSGTTSGGSIDASSLGVGCSGRIAIVPDVILDVREESLIALQANWMADYRNASGIVLDSGPYGDTVTLEDSSRVDPWIVRQAQRAAFDCTERLAEFSRRDHPSGG